MPIYEYECSACAQRVELLQRTDGPGPEACEACGGPMRRLLSAPAFQFKGTGWYVTDYAGRKSPVESGGTSSDSTETPKTTASEAETKKPKAASGGAASKAAGSAD